MANYGQYSVKESYMGQIEDYLDEFTLNGYSQEYKNFFSAVNQLTITPGDTSAKNQLINNAKSLADYFNTLTTNLRNVQADANNEIKDAVQQINSYAKNIAALNRQINQIEANYGNANDLRDKRNAMIDELSEIVNLETSEEDMGNNVSNFSVRINGQTLVSSYSYNTLETVARTDKKNYSPSFCSFLIASKSAFLRSSGLTVIFPADITVVFGCVTNNEIPLLLPSDAKIMEELNKLQSEKIFAGGTGSYFLESIVSDMSIDSQKAVNLYKNYTDLKTSIHNQRLSIMGVDTDEEAMDMIKYQQAYNLNSKMMSVMNQIYDKLINQTGI